jgi:hypothetical protein
VSAGWGLAATRRGGAGRSMATRVKATRDTPRTHALVQRHVPVEVSNCARAAPTLLRPLRKTEGEDVRRLRVDCREEETCCGDLSTAAVDAWAAKAIAGIVLG